MYVICKKGFNLACKIKLKGGGGNFLIPHVCSRTAYDLQKMGSNDGHYGLIIKGRRMCDALCMGPPFSAH